MRGRPGALLAGALVLTLTLGGRLGWGASEETPSPPGNPFEWIRRRAEEMAREREAERQREQQLEAERERVKRLILDTLAENERIARDPEGALQEQRRALLALERGLEALGEELAATRRAIEEAERSRQSERETLEKRLAELAEQNEALKKLIEENHRLGQGADEEIRKQLEALAARGDAVDRNHKRVIDVLKERAARDFETVRFDGVDFLKIPAGEFTMGTTAAHRSALEAAGLWSSLYVCETPARVVRIERPFFISKTETTQKLWRDIMGNNPSAFRGDDLPVERVRLGQIAEFLKRLAGEGAARYRLPTEAEWEYCARAGGEGLFGRAEDAGEISLEALGDFAWHAANSSNRTQPVARKRPNAWGLHDMFGNVWEWCSDDFHCDAYALAEAGGAPASPATEQVFRGGCWGVEARDLRAAARGGNLRNFVSPYVGFRIVREMSELP